MQVAISPNVKNSNHQCDHVNAFYEPNIEEVSTFADHYIDNIRKYSESDDDSKKAAAVSIEYEVKRHVIRLCYILKTYNGDRIENILEEETRTTKIRIITSGIGVKMTFTRPVMLPEIVHNLQTKSLKIGKDLIPADHIVANTFAILYKYAKADIDKQKAFLMEEVLPNIIIMPYSESETKMAEQKLKQYEVGVDIDIWKRTQNAKFSWLFQQKQYKNITNDMNLASYARKVFMTLPLHKMYPSLIAIVEDVSVSHLSK